MSAKFEFPERVGSMTPMAEMSWAVVAGARDVPTESSSEPTLHGLPAANLLLAPKDVAEGGALGNSLVVPEAYAGMMVTTSVKLVRPLGEGGMGSVWVADHLALHTQVVVKFIANELKDSKDATERFSREAAAAAQVKSPHVVQTFDHGVTSDGTPYIVMELLEGRDLGRHIDTEGRCSPEVAIEIVTQLARALDRAHERGIVHRDIKPGNIFLCDGGRGEVFVKLLDFGIAKGVDVPQLDSGTKTGSMIGSPFYMSPEQILGSKGVDRRSDLWSVGVVAYEMLTGLKPFDAETMGGLAIRIHSEPLPLPSQQVPALSPAVDAWFARACARNADERFTSCREMAEALAASLGGVAPTSARLTPAGLPPSAALAPTFAAGATTEAGLVRPASGVKTRNRVAALAMFGLCLCVGTVVLMKAARHSEAPTQTKALSAEPGPVEKNALTASAAPAVASVTSVVAEPAPAPPTPAVSAAPHRTERSQPKRNGASSKAGSPPLVSSSSPPPLPSAAASVTAPAKTGHDIF